MQYQNAKHGRTKIDIFSDHAVSITNTTGMTKIYHIEFDNGIMYQNPYYSPNAKKTFDIAVENGKSYFYGPERINQGAYFSIAGNYLTQATTIIKMDGKTIANCTNKNIAAIF
jgi:hypothetical protein